MSENGQSFGGFPMRGLQLLAELAANNNRAWFEAHKAELQTQLLSPAQSFVLALGTRLRAIDANLHIDPRTDGGGVLMRIYRDTRFSSDPSPYKTNVSGLFWAGSGKKTERPAFGFQLSPDGLDLMAGIFVFPPALLAAYRQAVADEVHGAELAHVLDAIQQGGGYTIAGAHYKRVPAGYDPQHPRATLLRYNGLYASPPRLTPLVATSPDMVDQCATHFQTLAPLYHWLCQITQPDGS
jgi:uncharacterized protein (TIGR02453 family)